MKFHPLAKTLPSLVNNFVMEICHGMNCHLVNVNDRNTLNV